MMKMYQNILWFFPLCSLFMLCSCTDYHDVPEIIGREFGDCFRASEWDSMLIRETLVGEWEMEYRDCFFDNGPETMERGKYRLRLTIDGFLIITESGDRKIERMWYVGFNDNFDSFNLRIFKDTLSVADVSLGFIFICDDQLLLENKYADGCDEYYFRIQ